VYSATLPSHWCEGKHKRLPLWARGRVKKPSAKKLHLFPNFLWSSHKENTGLEKWETGSKKHGKSLWIKPLVYFTLSMFSVPVILYLNSTCLVYTWSSVPHFLSVSLFLNPHMLLIKFIRTKERHRNQRVRNFRRCVERIISCEVYCVGGKSLES